MLEGSEGGKGERSGREMLVLVVALFRCTLGRGRLVELLHGLDQFLLFPLGAARQVLVVGVAACD